MSFIDFHLDTYNQLPVNCQSTGKKGSIFVPKVSQDISLASKADIILAINKKRNIRCCFRDKKNCTLSHHNALDETHTILHRYVRSKSLILHFDVTENGSIVPVLRYLAKNKSLWKLRLS